MKLYGACKIKGYCLPTCGLCKDIAPPLSRPKHEDLRGKEPLTFKQVVEQLKLFNDIPEQR